MDNTQLKSKLDEAFKKVEYLENVINTFKNSFQYKDDFNNKLSLRQYVKKEISLATNYVEKKDISISRNLYFEAEEYLAKAVYNLCSGCVSMRKGYLSWGEVTIYYSSFFAIHGLLRLQGKATGTNYVMFPKSIRNPCSMIDHEYVFLHPHKGAGKGIHEDVWHKFYQTYQHYSEIDQNAYRDAIFYSTEQDIVLEVERRNKYNYQIYEAYNEIYDNNELSRRDSYNIRGGDPQFFSKLTEYLGNADYRFIAKAALRIQLLHSLLFEISENNPLMSEYYTQRHLKRIAFLDSVLLENDPVSRQCIEDGCLALPS